MTPDKKENNELNDAPERKKPKLWGTIYFILGIGSLTFSIATLIHSFGMVPLYGTVTAAVLIGALGIFLIIYGYRIIRKDY